MQPVKGLNELRAKGGMTWIAEEHGWVATPEDILSALSSDGFEERKRETTTSGRDSLPAGGLWLGINRHTGSVASTIWVSRPSGPGHIMFITIDGESLTGAASTATDRDPYREDGGEA